MNLFLNKNIFNIMENIIQESLEKESCDAHIYLCTYPFNSHFDILSERLSLRGASRRGNLIFKLLYFKWLTVRLLRLSERRYSRNDTGVAVFVYFWS
jgi:hypothetical protein